ncbi:MAG TPA: hypothetical protein VFE62_05955 [Gemmataceae bacterium]|nr:hypothetical protein [Gemmataceae bacterium]
MTRNRQIWGCIGAIFGGYLISFLLPVGEVNADELIFGWEVFAGFFPLKNTGELDWTASNLIVWSPNLLLWLGVSCLAVRQPHFAVVLGMIAVGIATHVMLQIGYFGVGHPNFWISFWTRSGAYVWLASLLMLVITAMVFTIKQWRQTRSLPMLGE